MEEVIIMSSVCGKHHDDNCQSCQSAKESNDHRILQSPEAVTDEIARVCQRERILEWMCGKLYAGAYPVLLSNMRHEMGARFNEAAFEDLVRGGTIRAESPEARPGDSGRQFWGFAHTEDAALLKVSPR